MTTITNRHPLQKTKVVVAQSREEWTTREKLILASAVLRSGDQNWVSVSRAIKPLMDRKRGPEFFSQKNCAAQYSKMLEKVSTPKRKRSNLGGAETPGEQIVRRLTYDRIEELKRAINDDHATYRKLKKEEQKMISGKLDSSLPAIWSEIQAQKRAAKEADDIIESVEVTTPVHEESTTELINSSPTEDNKVEVEVQQEKSSPGEEPTESDNSKLEDRLVDTNVTATSSVTGNLDDAGKSERSSQSPQDAVKETDQSDEKSDATTTEQSTPQNSQKIEATLAATTEIAIDSKEEEDSNSLLDKDDSKESPEEEESTPISEEVEDKTITTILQQAVSTLHGSTTDSQTVTRSPLIASLLVEPSKCGKQLISTQFPFKAEPFNEQFSKVLDELNKESAAAEHPHLQYYWSRNTYEEIIQQLSGMSSDQRMLLMNTVITGEARAGPESSTVDSKSGIQSLPSTNFENESVGTVASRLSDIFKTGNSSSRTAAAAATIAAFLGDSKSDANTKESSPQQCTVNTFKPIDDKATTPEKDIKTEFQDEESDQLSENKFKNVQASTESAVVDVETVDPEPPALRESPTLRVTRSSQQTRGTAKLTKEKSKKPVKSLRRSRRSKPKSSSTADQESIEGDEDKDSLAEDDSIKHDESDDDRKSRSSDLTFEDDPREIHESCEHVLRRRTGSDSFPSSPSSISQSDDFESTQTRKNWKKAIMLMYRETAALKCASIFLHPVTDDEALGYHEIVKKHQMAEEMFSDFDERFQEMAQTSENKILRASGGLRRGEHVTKGEGRGLRRGPPENIDQIVIIINELVTYTIECIKSCYGFLVVQRTYP
ncbi:uncharacterized protein TRIADDRAFT_58588 [Trichoplax adhaerens]|uniref:Myb-like domain-containing protein n=1 Tax=Trichoplax adhaerens TaxID=10228 RepID=B3S344_TRIAD|nr:predicted protein [Trichoplax adhaerens]EDV22905.1 predicted protein [Trichoplax adhaerens]|eukprot:XP_002114771.1 predicted protein [Trichoplax adhaerens]